MRIPKNRPASPSSYRGNPTRRRSRERLLVAWRDNPTATNQQIADLCGVGITTACECKPLSLKIGNARHKNKAIKTELQAAVVAALQLNPHASLRDIANLCMCSKTTVGRIKARQHHDQIHEGLQTPDC